MSTEGLSFQPNCPSPSGRMYTLKARDGSVRGGTGGAGAPRRSLPCLSSNNSTEPLGRTGRRTEEKSWNTLQGNHKKTATLLALHVERLVNLYGIKTIGMLTLTFKDHVTDAGEAQARMNSLLTHIIRPRYRDYIAVLERTKTGRIHFHLLVSIGTDIRTDLDFAAVEKKDYKTANGFLRAEWSFWRKTAPEYRFGRTELLPIKSTVDAVKFYVGKYISKHIEQRTEEDKGVRLVRTSFNAKAGTTRFAWNTDHARLWREKLGLLCQAANVPESECSKAFGLRWAYKHQDIVQSVKLPSYATPELEELDSIPGCFYLAADALKFILEHGAMRLTPAQAAIALGMRINGGRKVNFTFEMHEFQPTQTEEKNTCT